MQDKQSDIAILMIKPHAVEYISEGIKFRDIVSTLITCYGLQITRSHTQKLTKHKALLLDPDFHKNKNIPEKTKKKVLIALTEGDIISYWIEGKNAYQICQKIKLMLRKAYNAENTSILNYLHTVDKKDFVSSSQILFDLDNINNTYTTRDILHNFELLRGRHAILNGRISSIRDLGGILFFKINDSAGSLQSIVKTNSNSTNILKIFKDSFKEGDIVSIDGNIAKSKTGEISLIVENLRMLSKSNTTINIDFKKKGDRLPVLLLMTHPQKRKLLKTKAEIMQICRSRLIQTGNIEMETPILNPFFNGGFSEPFTVKTENIDEILYLRVTSELYLKQMIMAGFEGVFEFGKQFRGGKSENISSNEYTALEFYSTFKDYYWMMEYIEDLFQEINGKMHQNKQITWFGHKIDFAKPWKRLTFKEAFLKYLKLDIHSANKEDLEKICQRYNVNIEDLNRAVISLFKIVIAPKLISPTFILNYPISISPLTKKNPKNKQESLKFAGYIGGKKIIDGGMEENDYDIQKENLFQQKRLYPNKNTLPEDKDFLDSLKYGMPPLAGISISIDRLTMLFTGSKNIREINPFIKIK